MIRPLLPLHYNDNNFGNGEDKNAVIIALVLKISILINFLCVCLVVTVSTNSFHLFNYCMELKQSALFPSFITFVASGMYTSAACEFSQVKVNISYLTMTRDF